MSIDSHLNQQTSLLKRLGPHLRGASQLDIAVAFARKTGANRLLALGLPPVTRAVIGLGFAITEPAAIKALAQAKVEVRLVVDQPETFHPKLYIITKPRELIVFSGSGNLTGGGLETNIEQYEEMKLTAAAARKLQRERFTTLWELGQPFDQSSAAWRFYVDRHAEIAKQRSEVQRAAIRITAAVARHARTSAESNAPKQRESRAVPNARRAQVNAGQGGQLTTVELHELLSGRDGGNRVAVTGRLVGTTQAAWLKRLKRAYPRAEIVNYGKVRNLGVLIVGQLPPSRKRATTKRRNARTDSANWIDFADARQLPRL